MAGKVLVLDDRVSGIAPDRAMPVCRTVLPGKMRAGCSDDFRHFISLLVKLQ